MRARRWAVPVIGVLSALYLLLLLYHASLTVIFPYDLDYGEGYVLFDAVRLARGEPIYTDIQQFPMVRSPYPPIFPWLWSLVVPLAGPQFWPGRMLAMGALLLTAGLVVWNAWRARVGWLPVVIAGAVVVGSPLVYQWAGYSRVDTLALLFSVSAVLAAQRAKGWRGIALAGVLCLWAVWTKQTAVAAPWAVLLAVASRSPRQAAGFVGILAVPSVLSGLLLESASGGQFSRNVLFGNAGNPFFLSRLVAMGGTFLVLHLPLVAGAVWWALRGMRGLPSPIAVYVLTSLLVAASAGNGGSSVNYFLEPIVACALALPYVWRTLAGRLLALAPLLAVAQLVMLAHWPNSFGTDYLYFAPHGRTPSAGDYEAGAAVDAAVKAEPREILVEPAGFAVRNGRPVYVQPIDLRAEAARGGWRSEPLVAAMRDRFGLVITAYNLMPFEVESYLVSDWRVTQSFGGDDGLAFRLYRPKAVDR